MQLSRLQDSRGLGTCQSKRRTGRLAGLGLGVSVVTGSVVGLTGEFRWWTGHAGVPRSAERGDGSGFRAVDPRPGGCTASAATEIHLFNPPYGGSTNLQRPAEEAGPPVE